MTGVEQQSSILLAAVQKNETKEVLFILPSDLLAERWNGRRLSETEADDASGIETIKHVELFEDCLNQMIISNDIQNIYLDFDKIRSDEVDSDAYKLAARIKSR